jgi:hypothetical protein
MPHAHGGVTGLIIADLPMLMGAMLVVVGTVLVVGAVLPSG